MNGTYKNLIKTVKAAIFGKIAKIIVDSDIMDNGYMISTIEIIIKKLIKRRFLDLSKAYFHTLYKSHHQY